MRPFADVSHYQGLINWTDYRRESDIAVIGAMDGTKRDPQFKRNRDHTRARAFRLVVYYYYLFDHTDPEEGARAFIELLADLRPHETVALDIEEGHGNQTERVMRWLDLVDNSIINRRSWIYSGDHFAQTQLNWAAVSRGRVRWVARYGPNPPRSPHDVWQYTSSGRIAGVKGNVDLNRYGASSRALADLSLRNKPRQEMDVTPDDVDNIAAKAGKTAALETIAAFETASAEQAGRPPGILVDQLEARARDGAREALEPVAAQLEQINTQLGNIHALVAKNTTGES